MCVCVCVREFEVREMERDDALKGSEGTDDSNDNDDGDDDVVGDSLRWWRRWRGMTC